MSVRSLHRKTRSFSTCLLWLLGCSLLPYAKGYVIVNSVSWSVTNEVEEEMDSSSTEDALPALLEDALSIWKQSYPASAYKEDKEIKSKPGPEPSKHISSPSRMFSYRREGSAATDSSPSPTNANQHRVAKKARVLAHQSKWGFLATLSAQEVIQAMPFGHILLTSDGPIDNSTGIPFCYVPPKSSLVSDLLKNPTASLTFADPDSDKVRKNLSEPEDLQCASLTLTGQMISVPVEEVDFARKSLYSRHALMKKWSQNKEWLLMKMNTEHIFLSNCYGGSFNISLDDYYRASVN
ncbi:protein CREG2 [Spea bombifrons]|uniref:protein CREG2 n=1 Tax=Spea bombifrons TaxID=233779 RepID=UPI00234902BB|nr:protein CREG2 [Spea bombifrons]